MQYVKSNSDLVVTSYFTLFRVSFRPIRKGVVYFMFPDPTLMKSIGVNVYKTSSVMNS